MELFNSKIVFEKSRAFGDILSASFQFIGQEFSSLLKIFFTLVVPFMLIDVILIVLTFSSFADVILDPYHFDFWVIVPQVSFHLLLVICCVVGLMLSTNGYMMAYNTRDANCDDPIQIKHIIKYFPHIFVQNIKLYMLIFSLLVCFQIILIGIFFLFPNWLFEVPVFIKPLIILLFWSSIIYLATNLLPQTSIIIYEKISILNSFKRSFELVKGNWWKTFFIIFLEFVLGLISYLAGLLVLFLLGFVMLSKHNFENKNDMLITFSQSYSFLTIVCLAMWLYVSMVFIIPIIIKTFVYFSHKSDQLSNKDIYYS